MSRAPRPLRLLDPRRAERAPGAGATTRPPRAPRTPEPLRDRARERESARRPSRRHRRASGVLFVTRCALGLTCAVDSRPRADPPDRAQSRWQTRRAGRFAAHDVGGARDRSARFTSEVFHPNVYSRSAVRTAAWKFNLDHSRASTTCARCSTSKALALTLPGVALRSHLRSAQRFIGYAVGDRRVRSGARQDGEFGRERGHAAQSRRRTFVSECASERERRESCDFSRPSQGDDARRGRRRCERRACEAPHSWLAPVCHHHNSVFANA